jgi:hypothetical protein
MPVEGLLKNIIKSNKLCRIKTNQSFSNEVLIYFHEIATVQSIINLILLAHYLMKFIVIIKSMRSPSQ